VSQKAIPPFACLQPWSVLGSGLQPAARVFAELSRPSISDSPENVGVETGGQLHLRITYRNGQWLAAEVVVDRSLGYGTYAFNLTSPTGRLDPNVVLGYSHGATTRLQPPGDRRRAGQVRGGSPARAAPEATSRIRPCRSHPGRMLHQMQTSWLTHENVGSRAVVAGILGRPALGPAPSLCAGNLRLSSAVGFAPRLDESSHRTSNQAPDRRAARLATGSASSGDRGGSLTQLPTCATMSTSAEAETP
jgi:hypothetical protein